MKETTLRFKKPLGKSKHQVARDKTWDKISPIFTYKLKNSRHVMPKRNKWCLLREVERVLRGKIVLYIEFRAISSKVLRTNTASQKGLGRVLHAQSDSTNSLLANRASRLPPATVSGRKRERTVSQSKLRKFSFMSIFWYTLSRRLHGDDRAGTSPRFSAHMLLSDITYPRQQNNRGSF